MIRPPILWPVSLILILAAQVAQAANVGPRWQDFLHPMPQRCKLGATLSPPSNSLVLWLPSARGAVAEQVASEITQAVGDHAQISVKYSLDGLGLVLAPEGADAAGLLSRTSERYQSPLASASYRDQSYALSVAPDGAAWSAAVVVPGGQPGLYYGAQTLRQLLQASTAANRVAPALALPRTDIVDWPDMPERGEWGGYAARDIPWLAQQKMNLVEDHASLRVDQDGRGHASYSDEKLSLARRHAIKLVPIITHLDQLDRTGIFERAPRVLAKGDPKGWTNWGGGPLKPVCWAEPAAVRVMGDWMEDLARIDGVNAVTVWLSEAYGQCKCPVCSKVNQYVMETRAALEAWRRARRINPKLELRILLTQGSYKYNESVLAEIPVGESVTVIYYHGGLTYMPYKREMIEPYMVEFTKRGGRLGVCPTLTASWRIVSPFSCPQFIHELMEEYHRKGLICLYGYATPGNAWWDMNVQAAAEWAWNRDGRSIEEFVRSWAVRRGIDKPEAVVRLVSLVAPAAWDVYASRVPYPWLFGALSRELSKHRAFRFGNGPLHEIKSRDELLRHQANVRRAVPLALATGDAELVAETRAIGDYLRLLETLQQVSEVFAAIKPDSKPTEDQKRTLTRLMSRLDELGSQLSRHLNAWADAVAGPDSKPPGRFRDTVDSIQATVTSVGELCDKLGVPDPGRVYRWHKIGQWRTEDFDNRSPVVRKIEVTDSIDGPGNYQVRFAYRSGVLGLSVSAVRLLCGWGEDPAKLRVVASDVHDCHAGAWDRGNLYVLHVEKAPAGLRWFVEITMSGGRPDQPKEKRSTNGDIMFSKQRP